MSRRASYHLHARFIINSETLNKLREYCSPSGLYIWVTTKDKLRIHTLKGVYGSKIDVLLPDYEPKLIICEIGLKKGSYDGNQRWRIACYNWVKEICYEHSVPTNGYPGSGKLIIEEHENSLALIALYNSKEMWAQSFEQVRYTPLPKELHGIFIYHWKKYFNFLPEEDVRQSAEVWVNLDYIKNCKDIVVLNRTASCMLYDLARQLGWRKLTLKDKKRIGLSPDASQWHKSDGYILKNVGVGEYTERSANNDQQYIRTSYGSIEEE